MYFCAPRNSSVANAIIVIPNPNPFRDSLRSSQSHIVYQPSEQFDHPKIELSEETETRSTPKNNAQRNLCIPGVVEAGWREGDLGGKGGGVKPVKVRSDEERRKAGWRAGRRAGWRAGAKRQLKLYLTYFPLAHHS